MMDFDQKLLDLIGGGRQGKQPALSFVDPFREAVIKEIKTRISRGQNIRVLELAASEHQDLGVECADLGAQVTTISNKKHILGVPRIEGYTHRVGDGTDISTWGISDLQFDILLTQNYLHTIQFWDALRVLNKLRLESAADCMLFVSALGLHGDHAMGYLPAEFSIAERFHEVHPLYQSAPNLSGPVCLYSVADIELLMVSCGFLQLWTGEDEDGSVFGVGCKNSTPDMFSDL